MRSLLVLLFATLFSTACLAGENLTYSVDGRSYEGYVAKAGPDAPLIVIIHDLDGLTDYEIKRAEMLVGLGYNVFAADLYGAGVRPTTLDDKKKKTSDLYKDRPTMRTLLNGALDAAKAAGLNTGNAVVVGYCFGGAAVLELARSGADLKGFVAFHGGLATPEGQDYSSTKGKLLILHGSADTAVSLDEFAALAKTLEEKQVAHEMITYSGAPHAFSVFDTPAYREDADKKSWKRFSEYLSETL